jgi:hypothetical protein
MLVPPDVLEAGEIVGEPVSAVVTAIAFQSITGFCAAATPVKTSAARIARAHRIRPAFEIQPFIET